MWSTLLWLTYHAFWYLLLAIFLAYVVQLFRLLRSDCDLTLDFYERWGRQPSKKLRGKVVWITGASSGIGEALAYQLAESGCKLVLSARREEELKRVCEKCQALSPEGLEGSHKVLPLDILKESTHADACVEILKEFGRIDVLVNNAGRSQRASAAQTKLEVDRALLELNTVATIGLTKAVLPHLLEQKEGSIVVISSVAGKLGAPGSASYSASKHALQGFFNTLRMEICEHGIKILSVCPGPVDTPFIGAIFREELPEAFHYMYSDRRFVVCLSASEKPGDAYMARMNSHQKFVGFMEEDPQALSPSSDDRVSSSRCAHLIAVAMANDLDEVWISKNPILFFTYMAQYAPTIATWVGKRIGSKRLKAVKAGKTEVNNYFSSGRK